MCVYVRVRVCAMCVCCVRVHVRSRVRAYVRPSCRQGLIVEIYSNNISLLQARACLCVCACSRAAECSGRGRRGS
jgi:hypothetical protein